MNIQSAEQTMNRWRDIVMKQPISKDMKDHLIEAFAINNPIDPNNYEVYVLGQNLNHTFNMISKPLSEWLKDNGYI